MVGGAASIQDSLTITDDEAVALAIQADTFWPGPLPTVEVGSSVELAAAAFRGNRSLTARTMLDQDGQPIGGVARFTTRIAGAAVGVAILLGDSTLHRTSWGIATNHYPGQYGWLSESVDPVGLHIIHERPLAEHKVYWSALLAGGFEQGPTALPDRPDVEWLTVIALSVNNCALAMVKGREARVGWTTAAKIAAGTVHTEPASLDEANDRIFSVVDEIVT